MYTSKNQYDKKYISEEFYDAASITPSSRFLFAVWNKQIPSSSWALALCDKMTRRVMGATQIATSRCLNTSIIMKSEPAYLPARQRARLSKIIVVDNHRLHLETDTRILI